LRHKDGNLDEKTPSISNIDSTESISIKSVFGFIKSVFGFILMMFGITMIITGVVWFMDDGPSVVVSQMAGIIMLMIGIPILWAGLGLTLIDYFRNYYNKN